MARDPAAWTNQWMRELSWREIIRINQSFMAYEPHNGIMRSRRRRLAAELKRRRKDGGGGFGAELDRKANDKEGM